MNEHNFDWDKYLGELAKSVNVLKCGHCGNKSDGKVVASYDTIRSHHFEPIGDYEAGLIWELVICPNCDGVNLRLIDYHTGAEPEVGRRAAKVLYPLKDRRPLKDKPATSIVDTFRGLLEAFDVIEAAYEFFANDGDWLQGEQVARKELYQWAKDVETALELAGREDELRVWQRASQGIEDSQIGSVLTTAKRKKNLFLQIRTRLYGEILPKPYADMPECVREDYEEAMDIFRYSARSAAALLRLALQKLCGELGEKGKNINDDIANLVAKGLPQHVQQALDIVRVVGNAAVHPGVIDIRDSPEIALKLFGLLNEVVEDRISKKKRIQEMYDSLPQSKLDAIRDRDKGKSA